MAIQSAHADRLRLEFYARPDGAGKEAGLDGGSNGHIEDRAPAAESRHGLRLPHVKGTSSADFTIAVTGEAWAWRAIAASLNGVLRTAF